MPPARILVVDDRPDNLRFAALLLRDRGYVVSTAADADQALRRLRAVRPRLILMDVQLPGTDGLTLTARLKADPATRDILIVALTAAASPAGRAKARRAGCDGYLAKPIDLRALARLLSRLLGRARGTKRPGGT